MDCEISQFDCVKLVCQYDFQNKEIDFSIHNFEMDLRGGLI